MEKFDSFFLKTNDAHFGLFVLIDNVIVLWDKIIGVTLTF